MTALPQQKRGGAAVTLALLTQTTLAVGTYLVGKDVMQKLDPLTVICARITLSAVVLGLLVVALGRPYLPPRSLVPKLILFGFLSGPINQGAFLYGLSRTHPAHASLLYALTPAGVYLGGLLLGRETLLGRRVVGIVVALGGVAVLLLGKGLAEASGTLSGDAWVLVAVGAWVVVTMEGKELARELGPLKTTSWMLIFAGGQMALVSPWLMNVQALMAAAPSTLLGIAYLVVLSSAASYLLYNFALSRADASAVAVFSNLQPVGTALAAWAIRGEPLTLAMVLGGALVLGGVRLAGQVARPPAGR
ncbi:MAG: DMT family transporter [Archangiaceae bacterium]|nr:DMT family transporter [Archangiaceae bacterium]